MVEALRLKPDDELDVVRAAGKRLQVESNRRRQAALMRMRMRKWKVPEGFRFDRDEANER
jgi:antitoxin MazE